MYKKKVFKNISHSLQWKIVEVISKYTQNNKVVYGLSYGSIWDVGVTTLDSTMYFIYILGNSPNFFIY
jgi:oligoendopeptidase F